MHMKIMLFQKCTFVVRFRVSFERFPILFHICYVDYVAHLRAFSFYMCRCVIFKKTDHTPVIHVHLFLCI